MSTTRTTTASQAGTLQLDPATSNELASYEVRHEGVASSIRQHGENPTVLVAENIEREAQPPDFDPTLASHPPVPYPVSNPQWWPEHYRAIPDYRPLNPDLDWEERRQSPLFTVVGGIMVAGCCMVANWAQLWRNTAGRVTNLGRSKVGGEW